VLYYEACEVQNWDTGVLEAGMHVKHVHMSYVAHLAARSCIAMLSFSRHHTAMPSALRLRLATAAGYGAMLN
jgi:hypothetical protein